LAQDRDEARIDRIQRRQRSYMRYEALGPLIRQSRPRAALFSPAPYGRLPSL